MKSSLAVPRKIMSDAVKPSSQIRLISAGQNVLMQSEEALLNDFAAALLIEA